MEISTEENEKVLSDTYTKIMEKVHNDESITEQENYIFQVELLSQEVNSGVSFEQYFRWVGKPEVDQIIHHLKKLGIPEVVTITQEAIEVAFPNGVPEDEAEYEECTEWNEDQEERLEELFESFKEYTGVIVNKLSLFIKENELT